MFASGEHAPWGASALRREAAMHARWNNRRCPQLWNRDHAPFCAQRKLARVTAWSKDHSSDAGRTPSIAKGFHKPTSDSLVMRLQDSDCGADEGSFFSIIIIIRLERTHSMDSHPTIPALTSLLASDL